MENLFLMLFLLSFICLIVGLIRPKTVIKWGDETNKTRINALKYFGISLLVSFVLVGITTPETQSTTTQPQEIASNENKEDINITTLGTQQTITLGTQQTITLGTQQTITLGDMKIHYIDVGQGDSELIQVDGKNILIDAGTSDNKALNYLKSIGVTTLDYVIATHPHEDHIGAMDNVIKEFNIGDFYSPQVAHTTKTFENMINALKNKNLKITVPKVEDSIAIGNATLTFLAPNSDKYQDLNNYSIVCKLKYGNTSFLFTGDAENVSEGEILQKQLDIQADVLKVGHHGSNSSTTQAFLDKVNPKYAIIEVGKDNDYGHPTQGILDKINTKGIKTFRTDVNGTIIATSNGKDITFNVSPVDSSNNIAGSSPTKAGNNSVSNTPVKSNISNSVNKGTSSSKSSGTTTYEPIEGTRTVYWTSGGKSYHYSKNCRTLARSKNILEGSASSCPKTDPCDVCVK